MDRLLSARLLTVVAAAAALAGCLRAVGPMGIPLRTTTRFEAEWTSYRALPPHKAFAVAGDIEGVYVSATAYGDQSAQVTSDRALRACEQRRKDRRIEPKCQTYAVDETIVAEPPAVGFAEP